MKICQICVGTMRQGALKELADDYSRRIPHYMPFELKVVPDIKVTKAMTSAQQKLREGKSILENISPGDYVVLCDERGRSMTSRDFATFIDRKASSLWRNLVFVIGGPFGFSQEVYDRADMMMNLSQMTFTHEMARVIMLEQIYRAMTILRGEPYHHD